MYSMQGLNAARALRNRGGGWAGKCGLDARVGASGYVAMVEQDTQNSYSDQAPPRHITKP